MRKCKYLRPPHEHISGASSQKNNYAGACNRADQRSLCLPNEVLVRSQEETWQLRLNLPPPRRDFLKEPPDDISSPGNPQGETDDLSGQRGTAVTNQQMQNSNNANRNSTIAILLPCVLIGHFV
jgi:hypothetical protein